VSLTVSRSIGTHESQKPSRSRRLTRRTRTSRRSNKETFTSAPEEEEKDTEGEEVDVRRGERRERRREKREGEDAAPSGRMNGATSDVVRGMPWRSRIARHCGGIDYHIPERIRNRIPNNDKTMDAGKLRMSKRTTLLLIMKLMHDLIVKIKFGILISCNYCSKQDGLV